MDKSPIDTEIATTIFKIKMTKMKLMGTNDFTYLSTQMQEQAQREWDLRQIRMIKKGMTLSEDKLTARNKRLDKEIDSTITKIKKLKKKQLELTYPNQLDKQMNSWSFSEAKHKKSGPSKQTKKKQMPSKKEPKSMKDKNHKECQPMK